MLLPGWLFSANAASTCDIVYDVDSSAFRSSCASTYEVIAFGVSSLSVSVFVLGGGLVDFQC